MFLKLQREARRNNRGLWSKEADSESGQVKDANEDEDTVYITKTGEKYHRAECRYLSKSKIPIKKSDAIAKGYEPCKVCKP